MPMSMCEASLGIVFGRNSNQSTSNDTSLCWGIFNGPPFRPIISGCRSTWPIFTEFWGLVEIWLQINDLTFFRSFKGRCHSSEFRRRNCENCHTSPHSSRNWLEYRNAVNSCSDERSTSAMSSVQPEINCLRGKSTTIAIFQITLVYCIRERSSPNFQNNGIHLSGKWRTHIHFLRWRSAMNRRIAKPMDA